MPNLRAFLESPLARHPRLLARKVAARLGRGGAAGAIPAPPRAGAVYPAHWAPALRRWLEPIPMPPPPHSFTRVFGQEFDERELLELCRTGPRAGERGLRADIKLIWDYSRGHALFTNAAAGAGPAVTEQCAAFLRRWLEANPDLNGPAWSCAMELAIRAVNWIFADTLLAGALGRQLGEEQWSPWLWRHGRLIWQRLEARIVPSNHYLADLLGLLVIGMVFPGESNARRWLAFARREFPRALLAQTRPDGGLNEASLRYHAYVTEMALLFRLAQKTPFDPPVETRLRAMCQIVGDFQEATGEVFAIGDDDSGRVLAVDAVSATGRAEPLLRLAALLLERTFQPAAGAEYPDSGWWVRRAGEFAVALDHGGVGLHGLGAHAHNDDLSICLDWRGQPVIVDPGTFSYTGDPEARNQFRSTWSHNTLVVDDREQRAFGAALFQLPGPDAACKARRLDDHRWMFTRPMEDGLVHRREVAVESGEVILHDRIEGMGTHQLHWRFHLHPAVKPQTAETTPGFELTVPHAGTLRLTTNTTALALEVIAAEYSPGYGRRQETRACAAAGALNLPATVEWRIAAG